MILPVKWNGDFVVMFFRAFVVIWSGDFRTHLKSVISISLSVHCSW